MPRGFTGDWDRMNRRYYDEGYNDGYEDGFEAGARGTKAVGRMARGLARPKRRPQKPKKKRTLSAWQKFMKSPKSQIKIKRGKDKGKLNLKAMAKEYRKKKRGKK